MTSKTGAAVAAIFAAASVPALALEAPQVNGPWRNPQGGSCDAPYFVGTPGAATQRVTRVPMRQPAAAIAATRNASGLPAAASTEV